MRRIIKAIILSSGWLCLGIFLISGNYVNQTTENVESSKFRPIAWSDHMQFFNGAIQCNLIEEELLIRKDKLKTDIFSNVERSEESENGYIYYFNDDTVLLASLLEHVQIEKACCPFFKFDISILPFNKGFALQISGPKAALKMIEEFEDES